jgi:excisionase family DNA binding protein
VREHDFAWKHFCYYQVLLLMATASLPTFLTVDELAAVLRCQPEKVYRLAARGELPSYKVEGRRLFAETDVVRWLELRHVGSNGDSKGGM